MISRVLLHTALAALLTILVAALPMSAAAGEEYDEATIAAVNEHFQNGAKLYYDENYDAAIAEFEAAHAKIPNAIFLYNISLAHAKKGDRDKSLATAEAAQQFGGLGESEQVQNEARIVAMRSAASGEVVANGIAAVPKIEPVFQFGMLSWIGSGLVVGGIIGLGGVLMIDRTLKPDVEAYKAAAAHGDVEEYRSLRSDLRPRQTGGRVLFVFSSLALVGGAGLLVYDLVLRKDESSLAVIPIRGGVGVSFMQRF